MYNLFAVLIVIIAILLILIVMVQNPKEGGLSTAFGGSSSNQMFGVQKTNDFLNNSTWFLALALAMLILGSSAFVNRGNGASKSSIEGNIENIKIDLPQANETPANTKDTKN